MADAHIERPSQTASRVRAHRRGRGESREAQWHLPASPASPCNGTLEIHRLLAASISHARQRRDAGRGASGTT
eukprot:3616322-Prymnesium_polylepis.1